MPRSQKIFSKRKFRGNQHVNKKLAGLDNTSDDEYPQNTPEQRRPRTTSNTVTPPSSSKKKLEYLTSEVDDELDSPSTNNKILVDLRTLSELISSMCKCKFCGSEIGFDVSENEEKRQGLVVSLVLECNNCKEMKSKMTSELIKSSSNRIYEANLRFIYATRCIGIGLAGSQTFCALMNLPPPPTKSVSHIKVLKEAVQTVANVSMRKAAEEAVKENNGDSDIAAAFDGTWQKRGYTSLNGVVTATSFDTGKVLDVEVLSKYCQGCTKYPNQKGTHDSCVKNYDGSSGGMEANGIMKIFRRSENERGVRYTKFLGDGDSCAYPTVRESKPYGEDTLVEKLECIGHIQKRVGSRLRNLKKRSKGTKLDDGKGLGGKGRLTDAHIDLLQNYYGLAIRRNIGNKADMKKAIWAIYFHKLSTDRNPKHNLCPKGAESWCGYQKSLVTGEKYHHKNSIPESILLTIKPIFRDLSKDDLLQKCLHGHTQNPNESLNNVIWSRIPKKTFVGYNTLVVGVMDAVISFNDGAMARAAVFKGLNIETGKNTRRGLIAIDKLRVRKAEIAAETITKEGRIKKRQQKRKREDAEDATSKDYGAGDF